MRKNIEPTVTGIELIQTINNELLKSVELTGIWERKLRQIERGEYKAEEFIGEMKEMVKSLVIEVLTERQGRSITIEAEEESKPAGEEGADGGKGKAKRAKKAKDDKPVEMICPVCKQGKVLKGNSAYGCSAFKNGCSFRLAFEHFGKKLTDKQVEALIVSGKTPKIKGFTVDGAKCDGVLMLASDGAVSVEQEAPKQEVAPAKLQELACPVCQQGRVLKGNSAFGCSRWKEGCSFKVVFDDVTALLPNQEVDLNLLQEFLKLKG